jgi:hypothetical protein
VSTDAIDVRIGSRLCENYFFSAETKYWFVRVAVTAKMIRLRYLPDSIIARKVLASEFSHSLGQIPLYSWHPIDGRFWWRSGSRTAIA